jgi:hypothetical protein
VHARAIQCTPEHANSHQSTPVHARARQFTLEHASAHQSTPVHARARQCTSEHAIARQTTQVHAKARQCTPEHASARHVKSALGTVFEVHKAYEIHKTGTVRPSSTPISTRMPFTPWPSGVSLSCAICDRIQYITTPPEPSLGTNKQNKQIE